MIENNLPALQVVLPLLCAPLCVLLRRSLLAWLVAWSASWGTAAISIAILLKVLDGGVISYTFGGWTPPWGIEYRIDAANAFIEAQASPQDPVTGRFMYYVPGAGSESYATKTGSLVKRLKLIR